MIGRQFLATNLWIWWIGSLFAFFLIGLIWASLFEYYFAGWNTQLIAVAGASLSLIVGSVYSTFLSSMTRNYLSGPTSYARLLVAICHAGDAIAGYYSVRDGDEDFSKSMIDLKSVLQHLGFYSYRLFSETNADRLGEKESRPTLPISLLSTESIASVIDSTPTIYAVSNIPPELMQINNDAIKNNAWELIYSIRIFYYARIARMRNELSDLELIERSMKPLNSVWQILEEIEVSGQIHEPKIFQLHIQALFMLYFFVWIPVSTWAAIGWIGTIIIYPFIAMAFLGIAIYNAWIGDPFHSNRPALIFDLYAKREQYIINHMEEKFKK